MAAAEAAVSAVERPITFTKPTPDFAMSKNSGKTVWYIAPDMSIPFIAAIASGVKAAAAAAGMKAVIFDGKGQVNTFNQGVTEAVSQKASGIILQGIDPALVSGPLAQAKAAGIPVIDSLNGDPTQPLASGVLAHVTVNYTEGGKLMADWVIAASKGTAHVVIFTSSIYTIYQNMLAGFKEEFAKLCPTTCKIDAVENVQPADVATQLGSVTSTAISRYPDAKYFVPFYDGMVTYMIPSVQQVHANVAIISHDGVTTNLDIIREGGVQQADVSNPPNPAMGWAEVDDIGRLMAGLKPAPEDLPQQLLVKANVGSSDTGLFPGYANYESEYESVWGK
ncbi:MAG: sugar ABC transporter substrate-binding protein [Streptosporangiaceae bacterium]